MDPIIILQAGVAYRLDARCEAVVRELVDASRFLRGNVLRDVEVANRTAEARAERGGVEMCDRSDTAPAFAKTFPGIFRGVAEWRNRPDTGHHNSSARQAKVLKTSRKLPRDIPIQAQNKQ